MKRDRRAQRQAEAIERQRLYDGLTDEQKLARARERSGGRISNEERKILDRMQPVVREVTEQEAPARRRRKGGNR